jgi:hypothetical protein
MQVIYKHINEAPVPPSQSRPELGSNGPIDRVIMKGLEKDRDKRYQSAVDFANDLEAACKRLKSGGAEEALTAIYPGSGSTKQVPFVPATEPPPVPPATQGPPAPLAAQGALKGPTTSAEPVAEAPVLAQPPQPTRGQRRGEATAKAAVLVLEGLEAGSTISYGQGQHAVAGLDGRAAVSLGTGTHEIEVTGPSGGRRKGTVTITPQELGSFKSLAMSQQSRPSVVGRTALERGSAQVASVDGTRSSAGKKIVLAASAVVILGLAMAAYIVTRGPALPDRSESSGVLPTGTQGHREASGRNARESKEEVKKEPGATKPGQEEPARGGGEARETPSAVRPPPSQSVPQVTGETETGEVTCVGVTVKRPDGSPLEGCSLNLVERPSNKSYETTTGPKGFGRICGLIPGHQVTIRVQGPKGKLLATRQLVLKAGSNPIEIRGT